MKLLIIEDRELEADCSYHGLAVMVRNPVEVAA